MDLIIHEKIGGVCRLTMNAPARLNALSDAMIEELHSTLDRIATDQTIKAVIIAGAGKAFCAGHNLKEMQAKNPAALKDLFDRCTALMSRIQSLPQPVIAQVHGIATAAGCQLVATCDLAIAADDTKFGVNGVNIGLFCSTPMVALSRNIPRKQAFEMLTTGQFIDAPRAETLGLINRSVPADQLASETANLANTLAAKLGSAVSIGKRAFYEQIEQPLEQAYAYTGDVMVQNMMIRDTEEGIAAFIDKRTPDWDQ